MKVTQKNFCFFRLVSSIVLWVVRKEKMLNEQKKRAQNIWLKIENSPLITRLYSNFNLFLLISSLSIIRFLPYHSNFHYRICVFLKLPVAVADWMTWAKKKEKKIVFLWKREKCVIIWPPPNHQPPFEFFTIFTFTIIPILQLSIVAFVEARRVGKWKIWYHSTQPW